VTRNSLGIDSYRGVNPLLRGMSRVLMQLSSIAESLIVPL